MTVVPAKAAGVPRIVVCSPSDAKGKVNPLVLVAADICGVDEVYKVGGAQAIAALAYGTKTIEPVRKIVGPGSKYVTAAKVLVSPMLRLICLLVQAKCWCWLMMC
jgi:histidinol dehydrogenase